jgi:hypothetical protein
MEPERPNWIQNGANNNILKTPRIVSGMTLLWPETENKRHVVGPGGAEGVSTEAALCLLYIGLDVWLVLILVSLLMALTGYRKRKYKTKVNDHGCGRAVVRIRPVQALKHRRRV